MGMKNVENNLLYDEKIETVRGRKYDQSKEATGKYSFASKRRKFFSPQNIFNRHPPLQKHHGQSLSSIHSHRYSQKPHKTFQSTVSPSEFNNSSNLAASGLLGIEPFVVVVLSASLLSFCSSASPGSAEDLKRNKTAV